MRSLPEQDPRQQRGAGLNRWINRRKCKWKPLLWPGNCSKATLGVWWSGPAETQSSHRSLQIIVALNYQGGVIVVNVRVLVWYTMVNTKWKFCLEIFSVSRRQHVPCCSQAKSELMSDAANVPFFLQIGPFTDVDWNFTRCMAHLLQIKFFPNDNTEFFFCILETGLCENNFRSNTRTQRKPIDFRWLLLWGINIKSSLISLSWLRRMRHLRSSGRRLIRCPQSDQAERRSTSRTGSKTSAHFLNSRTNQKHVIVRFAFCKRADAMSKYIQNPPKNPKTPISSETETKNHTPVPATQFRTGREKEIPLVCQRNWDFFPSYSVQSEAENSI